ncbi:MAG: hypothetical protein GX270_16475 [Clostridiaceae bacterium]|jgi:hypothetical protein|nr:hypothetical protein [Clostridiaceae bacterium]
MALISNYLVAKHICALDIDERHNAGDVTLVGVSSMFGSLGRNTSRRTTERKIIE